MVEPGTYELARKSGLGEPDDNQSEGAKWLRRVYQSAISIKDEYDLELYGVSEAEEALDDAIYETADGIVPIYTHELWEVWTDLQGYAHTDDLDEFLYEDPEYQSREINRIPQLTLYLAARRLLEEYA